MTHNFAEILRKSIEPGGVKTQTLAEIPRHFAALAASLSSLRSGICTSQPTTEARKVVKVVEVVKLQVAASAGLKQPSQPSQPFQVSDDEMRLSSRGS